MVRFDSVNIHINKTSCIRVLRMKEHFTLRYTASEDNDTVIELDMSFDNPNDEMLVQRMRDWLNAIGKNNVNVNVKDINEVC